MTISSQTDKDSRQNGVPNPAGYIQALQSLTPLPPSYIDMLRFHYFQPARTATAAAIADAVGFKNFRAASLHYGRLAGLVGEILGWRPQEVDEVKLAVLAEFKKDAGHWNWIMREELAEALSGLGWVETTFKLLPGEMPEMTELAEGAVYRVAVTAYERNPEARRLCLAHYGNSCVVCGFDFEATYGQEAEGFIHVHHLLMLSQIGKEYVIDPVKDLRPVCPNCHSVIHLNTPPHSIDEVKAMFMMHKERTTNKRRTLSEGT